MRENGGDDGVENKNGLTKAELGNVSAIFLATQ